MPVKMRGRSMGAMASKACATLARVLALTVTATPAVAIFGTLGLTCTAMTPADAPILIAYDGSDAARRAVRATAELFGSRRALVVTVWEPGLAYDVAALPTAGLEMPPVPIDVEEAQEVEHELHDRARHTAQDGAELARSLGLQADALAVADEAHVADAIVGLAGKRRVAAIVVGSRGLTGLRARLEGSTSNAVLKRASCPVVVVHDD
jgi:nucleotide-binding universal stress UspA family protein